MKKIWKLYSEDICSRYRVEQDKIPPIFGTKIWCQLKKMWKPYRVEWDKNPPIFGTKFWCQLKEMWKSYGDGICPRYRVDVCKKTLAFNWDVDAILDIVRTLETYSKDNSIIFYLFHVVLSFVCPSLYLSFSAHFLCLSFSTPKTNFLYKCVLLF